MNFSINSSGNATNNNFNIDLKSKTNSDIQVSSIYLQDQVDLTDSFKFMIGGRYDSFDITVNDIKTGTSQSKIDTKFSPRAGLIFKPKENISFYYSYSESFLPRSGEQYKSLSATAARLDPDVFESSEIGIKWEIYNELSLAAAYFDSKQTIATKDSNTGEEGEIIGLQVDGFEIELKGKITDKVNIMIGYSNMEGKTSSGGEPREIPDHTLALYTIYTVSDKFNWSFGITHQGESNIGNNNPDRKLPEYTRVDLGAYYQFEENLSIQMNIENVTNELYFPHSHSSHQVSVGEPFNIRFSIRKNF